MQVVKSIMTGIYAVICVFVSMVAAEFFAFILIPEWPYYSMWMMCISVIITLFGVSIAAGCVLGRGVWYLVALAPIIHFIIYCIKFVWLGLPEQMFVLPLSVISALCGGYIGAYIRKDDEQ